MSPEEEIDRDCSTCNKPINWERKAGIIYTQCEDCGRFSMELLGSIGAPPPNVQTYEEETVDLSDKLPLDPFEPIEAVVKYWDKRWGDYGKPGISKQGVFDPGIAFDAILAAIAEARERHE